MKTATRPPQPAENDIVMICKHLYESSSCRVAPIIPDPDQVRRFRPPVEFGREDGTAFKANWAFTCGECSAMDPGEIDFIETVMLHDRLHTDFL